MISPTAFKAVVDANYDGGFDKFSRDFSFYLTDEDTLYVASANVRLSQEFLDKVSEGINASVYQTEAVNFPEIANNEAMGDFVSKSVFSEELFEIIYAADIKDINVSVSRVMVDIKFIGVNSDAKGTDKIREYFSSVEGLNNYILSWDDETEVITTYKEEGGIVTDLSGRPERDTVINDEDVLNLKIALETATSLDELLAIL